MTEIEMITLQKAIKLLNASEVQYAIKTNDGKTYGTLPIVVEPVRKRRKVEHHWNQMFKGYKEQVAAMKVKDVIEFKTPPGLGQAFQSALTGCAAKVLGPDNYTTTVRNDGCTVQILCTGTKNDAQVAL